MGRDEALNYAIAPLAHGVRRALGLELWQQPHAELVPRVEATFAGANELQVALEDAYERSLQSIVIGLKSPWLLMETGEKDYAASFQTQVREPFTQESGIEGRLLIDFLDGFFLDYDTALDAGKAVLGIGEIGSRDFFARLLAAGDSVEDANVLAARATETIKDTLLQRAGLEMEHPIVRFAQWREILADGLIFHFADIARAHPSWSRYLDLLDEEKLARQDMRAVAQKDENERARIAQARGLLTRIENYRAAFGEILPNREWLFDLADRLEDSDENVESELLQGRPMLARELPVVVKAAVAKIAQNHGIGPTSRAADALLEPKATTIDVLKRSRRDFRRCHWTGEGYADAAFELGSLIFGVLGPRAAERYYRESLAFGGNKGANEYALYMSALALEDRRSAIHHLQAAVGADSERFEPFDMQRYQLDAILGAGGTGVSFLVAGEEGRDLVVKTFWDEMAVVDPRPALKDLQTLVKAKVPGAVKIHHLCGYKKRATFVVSEFVAGDDLETFREAQGGEAPARVTAEIGASAASVLAQTHAAGVTHRNLKPGNVRVGAGDEGLEVTLLDFCVPNYVLAAPERIRGVRRLASWSRLGRQIAEDLAAYTAPEVLRGGLAAATPRADLYSLGATLYRLATGASPRRVDPEGIPNELRDILVKCLEKNPDARPASAEEVRDALRAAASAPMDESGEMPAPTLPASKGGAAAPALDLTLSQEAEFGLQDLVPPPPTRTTAPSGVEDPFVASGIAHLLSEPGEPPKPDPFAPAGPRQMATTLADDDSPGFEVPGSGGFDAYGGTIGLAPAFDPFKPTESGDDPFAGAGTGSVRTENPFAPPKTLPTPRPMPRPKPNLTLSQDPDPEPMDPSDALALLEALLAKRPKQVQKTGAKAVTAKANPKPAEGAFFPPTAGDPFGGGAMPDPFAGVSLGDPFGSGDPFGGSPGGGDTFPATDAFGAPAAFSDSGPIADPLAAGPGGGGDKFFLTQEVSSENAAIPELAIPPLDDLPTLDASTDGSTPVIELTPSLDPDAILAAPPAAKPAAKAGAKPGGGKAGTAVAARKVEGRVDEDGYGLVVSNLALKSKKEAAVTIISELRNISREEAYELCRSPVVPVLKRVTKAEAEAAAEKFKAAKVQCRITEKRERR